MVMKGGITKCTSCWTCCQSWEEELRINFQLILRNGALQTAAARPASHLSQAAR